MNPELIIYPAIAMFALTFLVFLMTGAVRFRGIRGRRLSIKYYRLYNEGAEPADMRLLSRHLQNHFEVPPIFYVVVLLTFVTDSVTMYAVVASWVFVALRGLHSFIHLTTNNVTHRFATFVVSGLVLATLWLHLLLRLVD